MKCEDYKKYIYDFHDQLLSNELNNEMESHLRECTDCFEVNKKYEEFLNKFSSLPKSIQPERDLWEDIKSKTAVKKNYNFNYKIKFLAIAASFIFIILFSAIMFFYSRNINSDTKILRHFNSASGEYNKARESLISTLHSKEVAINKETIDIIESNLLIMDQAINEIKAAINKEPDNQSLVLMLADTYHKETKLLLSTRDLILNIRKSGG